MQMLLMTKTTSVNICFGKLKLALGQNINILSSVFTDQLGLADFHSQINMNTDTALLLPL